MMKQCANCKWQDGCIDSWEDNPKIDVTGCCKFERKTNKNN